MFYSKYGVIFKNLHMESLVMFFDRQSKSVSPFRWEHGEAKGIQFFLTAGNPSVDIRHCKVEAEKIVPVATNELAE